MKGSKVQRTCCFMNRVPWKDLSTCCPLRLYGDGADAQTQQHFEIHTILPVLACNSSALDSRILCSVRNSTKTTNECRTQILEVLAWSFESLRTLVIKKSVLVDDPGKLDWDKCRITLGMTSCILYIYRYISHSWFSAWKAWVFTHMPILGGNASQQNIIRNDGNVQGYDSLAHGPFVWMGCRAMQISLHRCSL